jgi:hypothetical protein
MDLVEIEWGVVVCIGLGQDPDKWKAHVNAVTGLRVP